MTQAYRNLRNFIYINVKAQYRGEGYRLVKKLMDETREITQQRITLDKKLSGRKLPSDWVDGAGIPNLNG